MEEEKKEFKYVDHDIVKIKFNFDDIDKWRRNSDKEDEDFPVCSFLSFYEACGLEEYFKKYNEETGKQIIAFDNLFCNFYTLQAIKNYIKKQWQIYSLDIDGDLHVFWRKDDTYGKSKHYPRKLKNRVEKSITFDFANFCPGEDDELEDYEIVFRVFEKVEVTDEDVQEEK